MANHKFNFEEGDFNFYYHKLRFCEPDEHQVFLVPQYNDKTFLSIELLQGCPAMVFVGTGEPIIDDSGDNNYVVGFGSNATLRQVIRVGVLEDDYIDSYRLHSPRYLNSVCRPHTSGKGYLTHYFQYKPLEEGDNPLPVGDFLR